MLTKECRVLPIPTYMTTWKNNGGLKNETQTNDELSSSSELSIFLVNFLSIVKINALIS